MKIRVKQIKLIITILILLISMSFRFSSRAAPSNDTVEGEGNHFVTGQSYPSQIVFAGYDVVNKKMYANFTLSTEKAGPPTLIDYNIKVFDAQSNVIGTVDPEAPATLITTGVVAPITAKLVVTDQEIILTDPLTAEYHLVVTVISTS